MAQNKDNAESTEKKPEVKVQDLTPEKDAKGGARNQSGAFDQNAAGRNAGQNRFDQNSASNNASNSGNLD